MTVRDKVLVGDWEKLFLHMDKLPSMLKKYAGTLAKALAVEVALRLQQQIIAYSMIRTGNYLKLTQAYEDKTGWYAGVPDQIHPASNIEMRTLAYFLEMGTVNMDARPHYRVVYAQMPRIVGTVITKSGLKFLGLR